MAVRHRLIKASPSAVWDVLADGTRYAEWVVGTASVRPKQGEWPREGATIEYKVRLGPLWLTNETVVRRNKEGSLLELEAHAGILGTARIAIELRDWGENCLVIIDEHPLQGAGGVLHNLGFEALIQLRHRTMLARLAGCCEDGERSRGPSERAARSSEGAGHAGRGAGHA